MSQQDRAAALRQSLRRLRGAEEISARARELRSVARDPDDNWRAWQNRAAAHLGSGQIEESLRDIQRGLQLNPDSQDLQKTLAIARGYEKLQQERMRHLLES